MKKKECKRHKWRVGAQTNCIIVKKQIIPTKRVIWCEKCDKVIRANIYSKYELEKMREKR